jgi:hypothetical protein
LGEGGAREVLELVGAGVGAEIEAVEDFRVGVVELGVKTGFELVFFVLRGVAVG